VATSPTLQPAESAASARAAGLRYANGLEAGITRRRAGRGFTYRTADGAAVADKAELERIRRLAIPPAWTDVWISPRENDHLQATGRDARGRKQYRYHDRWRKFRDAAKFARLVDFAQVLGTIRARVDADLRSPSLTRDHVLAVVIRLLEQTLVRVGNDEYAKRNRSFGLTTLRDRHVAVMGARIRLRFRGKSGVEHEVDVWDRRIARVVQQLDELPGRHLFQYVDERNAAHPIGSDDVNAYLRDISGAEITAKDYRTWAGTVLAARALAKAPPSASEAEAKRVIGAAIDEVARRLRNTRAICLRCYVHPAIIEGYRDGSLLRARRRRRGAGEAHADGLDADERWVLRALRAHARREPKVA